MGFGSDGLSIQTEEGSVEFDAETGEFVLVDQDGEGTLRRGTVQMVVSKGSSGTDINLVLVETPS